MVFVCGTRNQKSRTSQADWTILCHIYKTKAKSGVNLSALLKIAEVMNCNTRDMMDFVPDDAVIEQEETEK